MPKDTTILARIIALDAELSVHLDVERSKLVDIDKESDENLLRLQVIKTELTSSASEAKSITAQAHIKPINSRVKDLDKSISSYNKRLSSLYSKTTKILDTIKAMQEKGSSSILDTSMAKAEEIIAKIDEQQYCIAEIGKKISAQQEIMSNIDIAITQQQFPDKLRKIDVSISKIKGNIHDVFRAMADLPIAIRREQETIDSIRTSVEEINSILTHSIAMPMLVRHISSTSEPDSGTLNDTRVDPSTVKPTMP